MGAISPQDSMGDFSPYMYDHLYVPSSKVAILGMVIPPFHRNPYNGYINSTIGLMTMFEKYGCFQKYCYPKMNGL